MSALATWLARQEKSHPHSIDMGLARVLEVARRLDLLTPAHSRDRKTITVGGTNGKGSTVAFLDGILRAAGKRVGRFTSPHLSRYNERICIDGIEADVERCREFAESSPSIVTPLNKYIGYEEAAAVAKQALKERRTIREVVIERGHVRDGHLTEEQLDAALDVLAMARGGH